MYFLPHDGTHNEENISLSKYSCFFPPSNSDPVLKPVLSESDKIKGAFFFLAFPVHQPWSANKPVLVSWYLILLHHPVSLDAQRLFFHSCRGLRKAQSVSQHIDCMKNYHMGFYSICKLLEVIGINVNFLLVNSGDYALRPKLKEYHTSVLVLHLSVSTWNIQSVDFFPYTSI